MGRKGRSSHRGATIPALGHSRREIAQLDRKVRQKGYSLVPLRLYFTAAGYAKLEVGLGRGKRQYDKREALKEADEQRRADRAVAER